MSDVASAIQYRESDQGAAEWTDAADYTGGLVVLVVRGQGQDSGGEMEWRAANGGNPAEDDIPVRRRKIRHNMIIPIGDF